MKKISVLLKLCYKFSKQYMSGYLMALTKPILVGILGIMFLFSLKISVNLVLLSLLSIPCMCYAFWRGYVITYALIPCADSYIKDSVKPFGDFIEKIKENESQFIKYVCFMAILSVILYIPAMLYIFKTIPLTFDNTLLQSILDNSRTIDNTILANTLLLAPFLNYALCAFYYKKENESFLALFANCYKKLDIYGVLIALIITLISYKGSIIYLILAILLNPFIYSINTFWYSTKEEK